ncbi:hypothetical protein FJY71_06000, partial [candidate division WOR-3 bacterium]|nr:hypothetical protein [candidate division WOR-3 bacterium]
PLDRCSGYDLQRYPAGNASYLFGSRFFGHLARGDSGVWDRFNESHAGLLPFLENAHALKVVDRPFVPLWKEWQRSLAARADSADRRPASESLALLRRLTREGFDTGSPLWSKTGAEVYYLSRSGAEYPAIKKAAWDGSYVRVLHRGLVTGSLSLSPDGTRLAFSEYEVVRNGCVRTDIHSLDLATRAVRRLTNGLRARDPDFAPDSSLLVFVVNHDAGNDVVLMDLETGERRTLAESPDRTSFHTPRFSPGGRWVAVGVSRPGGWSDIELIDRTTGWTLPITEDRANDLWPSWSRDGRFLFFVSDRTGVFNLYAHSVEDRQLYRCTSVDDGVFEPAVGPGMRRVALIAHTAEGSDVHLLEIVPGTWAPAEPFADTMPELTPSPAPVGGRLYYYNPSPSVWPGFWLPWLAASGSSWEAGAFTLGWDVLQLHSYSGFAGYRAATRSPFLRIGYTCSRFRPAVSLSADVDGRLQLAAVGLDLPFYLTARSHWLTAALSAAHDSTFRTALAGSWTCSDAPVYRFCVAPTEGRTAGVAFDARARALAGACDRGRLTAFWARYFGAPRRTWSLRLLIAAGTAFGDSSADCAFALEPGPGRLAVRGFREAGPAGRHVAVAGVQLRVPLWWPERGISTLPLFLRNVNAAVFAEAGSVLSDSGAETRAGTGLELRVDLNVLHHVPVNIGFGAAAGLVPALSRQLYLRIESAMLSDLLTGKGPRRSLSPEPW